MTDETTPTETTDAQEATTDTSTTEQVETFDREYVEKLRKENAAYRTKAKAAEEAAEKARLDAERQKLDEVERLKAELADRDKAIADAKAQLQRERTLRTLTPDKVVDAEDALLIAEHLGLVDEDGNVDLPALLKAKPHLARRTGAQTATPGAGGNIASKQTQLASLQDQLKNAKSMAERVSLQRQIHELQKG